MRVLMVLALVSCSTPPPSPRAQPPTESVEPRDVPPAPAPIASTTNAAPKPARPLPSLEPSSKPAPKLANEDALACAKKYALAITPIPELELVEGVSPVEHWYRLKTPSVVVLVNDDDCSAAFAPSLGAATRFDAAMVAR